MHCKAKCLWLFATSVKMWYSKKMRSSFFSVVNERTNSEALWRKRQATKINRILVIRKSKWLPGIDLFPIYKCVHVWYNWLVRNCIRVLHTLWKSLRYKSDFFIFLKEVNFKHVFDLKMTGNSTFKSVLFFI